MTELLDAMEHSIEDVTVIPSKGGVFEVTVDDKLVFSKKALGRHAKSGEIVKLITNG